MWWIIYISGFILTYLMCKWLRNKAEDNTWGDVGATIFASIFSWGAIVFMVLALGVIILNETIKAKNPPKWL
jgi:hypothetical protein